MAATIHEATRVEPPLSVDGIKRAPLDGVSFADIFRNGEAAVLDQALPSATFLTEITNE